MGLSDDQIVSVILNGKDRMPKVAVSEDEARAIVAWLRATL
jgi:mono/diheme cytochrome c family protein